MSKMTLLEAFDELHCTTYGMKSYDDNTIEAEKLIEAAVKRLEKLETMHCNALNKIEKDRKKLKALEIIKECVGVNMILYTAQNCNVEKEKVDLLKEILL